MSKSFKLKRDSYGNVKMWLKPIDRNRLFVLLFGDDHVSRMTPSDRELFGSTESEWRAGQINWLWGDKDENYYIYDGDMVDNYYLVCRADGRMAVSDSEGRNDECFDYRLASETRKREQDRKMGLELKELDI